MNCIVFLRFRANSVQFLELEKLKYLLNSKSKMQFNAEYVASSGGEVYNRSENAEEQTVSEMGDSFYNFLNDFHVNSSYIYRYWND